MSCAKSRPCQSQYHQVRDLKLHARHWRAEESQQCIKILLHGWLDLSATWQRVIDYLPTDWTVIAPDQRGFGHSSAGGDTYWFYDYLGDLDILLDEVAGDTPVDLIGHSMGSQVAALYAGVRPDRIRRLVALDGFYLPQAPAERAPLQIRKWLNDLREAPAPKIYPNLETLAQRIAKRQPGLDEEGALFVAECWSEPTDDGQIRLLGDERHRQHGPLLYRDEEAKVIFSQVTAPTLILDAGASHMQAFGKHEVRQQRLACFKDRVVKSIPDAGHMLHFDAPQATADAISEFLNQP